VTLRLWAHLGGQCLKPHRIQDLQLRKESDSKRSLEDIVGLLPEPPEHAIVLSCDERVKSRHWDRTQPGSSEERTLPTMTHDYKRNGTTSLFAAINTADGRSLAMHEQAPASGMARFLNLIKRSTPADKEIHIILTTTPAQT